MHEARTWRLRSIPLPALAIALLLTTSCSENPPGPAPKSTATLATQPTADMFESELPPGWGDEDAPPEAPAGWRFEPQVAGPIEQTAAGGTKATERVGEDWPNFLGPRGTGISGETGLLETWPEKGPPVVWKKRVGESYSAPSVRGNRLVLFHRPEDADVFGDEEAVDCFAADTGKPLWHYAYPTHYVDNYGYNGGPRCTPILAADRCYTFGAEGVLTCLNLADGNLVWQRKTSEEFKVPRAFFGVGPSPILEGNLLIVMLGAHPHGGVVAFDAQTGQTIWESVGPDAWPDPAVRIQRDRPPVMLSSYSTPMAATIHGKRHVLGFMRPGLVSVDPVTGEINFSFWFRSELHDSCNAARPVVVGDNVFLSAAYETGAALLKVEPDGKHYDVIWQDVNAMQNHWSTSIYHDGYLYGFSGRHEPGSTFRCIEMATGKLMWATKDVNADDEPDPKAGLGATVPKFYGRGSAVLAEGKFIVLGERGTLALVDVNPRKFVEISRARYPEAGYPSWVAPVLSRQRLYLNVAREIRDRSGRYGHEYHLLCLDLKRP
jgi:outer membrane protein assembly factor BamB